MASEQTVMRIGPLEARPGAFCRGGIDAGVASIPLLVYRGRAPGPTLYVQAAQHGLELNGCEVMRRLIATLRADDISGTLILVPLANPLAARVHMQSFPFPDRPTQRKTNDMNRRWSVPLGGANHVDRMVAALAPVVAHADVAMDLHCHEYLYPCMALSDMSHPGCRELALATGMDVVRSAEGQEGMFGRYCRRVLGIRALTIEMPPLRRVDHGNVEKGYRAVLNVMCELGMSAGHPELPDRIGIYGTEGTQSANIVAEREGFFARYAIPGEFVASGTCVGEVFSPDTFESVQRVTAPFDSVLMSLGRPPSNWGDPEQDFVNVGDRLTLFTVPSEIIECPDSRK